MCPQFDSGRHHLDDGAPEIPGLFRSRQPIAQAHRFFSSQAFTKARLSCFTGSRNALFVGVK